ncbi:hypothetical protein [Nostoc linckia]|nr:hypothetical protein [Nostoc linckia]
MKNFFIFSPFHLPHTQCPMPNAPCPMPHTPFPSTISKVYNTSR